MMFHVRYPAVPAHFMLLFSRRMENLSQTFSSNVLNRNWSEDKNGEANRTSERVPNRLVRMAPELKPGRPRDVPPRIDRFANGGLYNRPVTR